MLICKILNKKLNNLQEPQCTSNQLKCVQSIKVPYSNCLPPCSGLIFSKYDRYEANEDFQRKISKEVAAYRNYTKWFEFPARCKGLKLS